jgi:D-alanyl-D-alanine carboxypeptidase/D-alanyl-D-alanine-endopeptidase (penicillin-binding protein 4)
VRRLRPLCALAAACALWPAAPAAAAPEDGALRAALGRSMRAAGPFSGALVVDQTDGRVIYALRPDAMRVPASNEKLFVTAATLLRYGAEGRLTTRVRGVGRLEADGTWRGTLYLRGGGDPTFGSLSFTRRAYGGGATTYELAGKLAQAGIRRVVGPVLGDESVFDRLRSPYGFGLSLDIGGPLSGLAYDRGRSRVSGTGFQLRPATFAASQLIVALRARGISVAGAPGERPTPHGARELASVDSPPISTIVGLVNRPSDNYLAEMLIKALGASFAGRGTTAAGAGVVRARIAAFGAHPRVVDGSGLSRANLASPRHVVRLLTGVARTPAGGPFYQSLAIAGRSGTLAYRMRGTAAAGRCRGKTGTLIGVSALSGYCETLGGRRIAFSILMNRVSVSGARALQNAMAVSIVRYSVTAAGSAAPPRR